MASSLSLEGSAVASTTHSTSWQAGDLRVRLCAALDLASQALDEFGTSGYVDELVPQLSFGPEKVAAEAAMLAYASSGLCDPAVRSRVRALGHQLIPIVRSRRALADIALQPARAFKHAVPHVLLELLGHRDDAFDRVVRQRCAVAGNLAGDLPPSGRLERLWITNHWEGQWRPYTDNDTDDTFIQRPIDAISQSRDEAYAHTHLLFYLTDFGCRMPPARSRPADTILREFEGLLLKYLDLEDYDLAGELLMAWPQLRAPWSPTAAFAFRVLATVEDAVGLLPCGNVDIERMTGLSGVERRRYALASAYHTAFVMGFLCAVSLRDGCLPPATINGVHFPDDVWQAFLSHIDDHQGHWLAIFNSSEATEKSAMAPLLCNLAIVQNLRKWDYEALRDVLLLADRTGLPEHPLRTRATDILGALAKGMEVAGKSG